MEGAAEQQQQVPGPGRQQEQHQEQQGCAARRRKRKQARENAVGPTPEALQAQMQTDACTFFLHKKRRFCRLPAVAVTSSSSGSKGGGLARDEEVGDVGCRRYCSEHAAVQAQAQSPSTAAHDAGSADVSERVPCPLDPRHTVAKNKLTKHLKVCNVTKKKERLEAQPFFVEGINLGDGQRCAATTTTKKPQTGKEKLDELSGIARGMRGTNARLEDVHPLVAKIEALYEHVIASEGAATGPLSEWVVERDALLPTGTEMASNTAVSTATTEEEKEEVTEQGNQGQEAKKEADEKGECAEEAERVKTHDYLQSQLQAMSAHVGELFLARVRRMSSFSSLRHALQGGAIVRLLRERSILRSGDCIVEMGAGRGFLGLAVVSSDPTCSLVFVDRDVQRQKADRLLRNQQRSVAAAVTAATAAADDEERGNEDTGADLEALAPVFERVRADIGDLNLAGLPLIPKTSSSSSSSTRQAGVTCVAKHLCGGATDLALRALRTLSPLAAEQHMRCMQQRQQQPQQQQHTEAEEETEKDGEKEDEDKEEGNAEERPDPVRHGLSGVAIATCCHHHCDWDTYINTDWMREQGVTPREFALMTRMSSWALSQRQAAAGWTEPDPVVRGQKCLLGYKIKTILDAGRVAYLRTLGLQASAVRFCDPSLSPENRALIAHPPAVPAPGTVAAL